MQIKLSLLLVVLCFAIFGFAQTTTTLHGIITDEVSGTPIPAAHVFVANTSVGTYATEAGIFILLNSPIGQSQELVVSHLGYQAKVVPLANVTPTDTLTIRLSPNSFTLATAEVSAKATKGRKRQLRQFTQALLGKTDNARHCRLLNPEVVRFHEDAEAGLQATAQELLVIENSATGYQIFFWLTHFSLQGQTAAFSGKPHFVPLPEPKAEAATRWETKREATYLGSRRHFFQALLADRLPEAGFSVFQAKLVSNSDFETVRTLQGKNLLQDHAADHLTWFQFADFLKVTYAGATTASSGRASGNRRALATLGRPAERDMIAQEARDLADRPNHQTSYLFARKRRLLLQDNGTLQSPEHLIEYGHWATTGLADWLPLDYHPALSLPKPALSLSKGDTLPPPQIINGFKLENLTIPAAEIVKGGPPRDGIPSIDHPKFIAAEAVDFLRDDEQVLGIALNGEAKAYPIKILDRHEIVNDSLAGQPIVVTYCPLCGSGVIFDAKVANQARTFGVSGLLYNSDVLLYDRQTNSLWSQIMGQAVSGPSAGQTLTLMPVQATNWAAWRAAHPQTKVLSTDTGFARNYEEKAYAGYAESPRLLFPVQQTSDRLGPKAKVIGIEVNGQFKAYPLQALNGKRAGITDRFNGQVLKIFYDKKADAARIENTAGEVLPATTLYWFAWYAFHPDTEVYPD